MHAGVATTCLTTCGPESSTPALQKLSRECATEDSLTLLPAAVSHQVNWESCFAHYFVGAEIHVLCNGEIKSEENILVNLWVSAGLPGSHLRIKLDLCINCLPPALTSVLTLSPLPLFLSVSSLLCLSVSVCHTVSGSVCLQLHPDTLAHVCCKKHTHIWTHARVPPSPQNIHIHRHTTCIASGTCT